MRKFNWSNKAKRRRTEGTGRMRYMKTLPRKFKNGFREGVRRCPPPAPSAGAATFPGGFRWLGVARAAIDRSHAAGLGRAWPRRSGHGARAHLAQWQP